MPDCLSVGLPLCHVAVLFVLTNRYITMTTLTADSPLSIPSVGLICQVLQDGFVLGSLVSMAHHSAAGHGEIDIYCMNPIFTHRCVFSSGNL